MIQAAYQDRFNRYLADRGIIDTAGTKVWCFAGDGEMDEPESLAAVALAGREHLDNLVFVANCNLQRLDGPVRGDGKVVQELEGIFAGRGWHVVKVVWRRDWDPLLAADASGVLVDQMNRTLDGEYQELRVEPGAYIREHFFGPDPRLRQLVASLSDEDLRKLRRGGHDPVKVHAAYRAALEHRGVPTVVLAKTVKGWALGPDISLLFARATPNLRAYDPAFACGVTVIVRDGLRRMLVADQIGRFVPEPYVPLGTDGFGLSDTRAALRRHFEVDAPHIVVAALWGLLIKGDLKAAVVSEAVRTYGLDADRADPRDA